MLVGYESARPDVQSLVPASARAILDLGCSNGALGAALKARQGATVLGVELGEEYAREAEARLDRVIVADAEAFAAGAAPPEAPFDCLIAADVLEHLRDPWAALRGVVAMLAPGGDRRRLAPQRPVLGRAAAGGAHAPLAARGAGALRRARTCAGSARPTRSSCSRRPGCATCRCIRATGSRARRCGGGSCSRGRRCGPTSRRS